MQVQKSTSAQAQGECRKWTVLVYSAADNNLHDALVTNLQDAEKVGSSDTVAIAAQIDHGSSVGCDRMLITKSPAKHEAEVKKESFLTHMLSWFRGGKAEEAKGTGLSSPVLEHLGNDVNMSDPKTLANFIEWGMKAYPAEHTLVIISDHGAGWQGAVQDEGSGGWMKLRDLNKGLEMAQEKTGKKIDLLGFDACLMANAEVAEALKDKASYLVASEETEGAAGWQYNEVLTKGVVGKLMKGKDLDVTPEELAKHIVKVSSKHQDDLPTLSVIDNAKVDGMTASVKTFAEAILNTSTKMGVLRADARATQAYYENKDLADFASRVAADPKISDTTLKVAAQGVVDAVKAAVVAEEHSEAYSGSKGVTVNLGSYRFSPNHEYRGLDFAAKSEWDKALDRMGKYWFWPTSLAHSTFHITAAPGRPEQAS